MSRRLLLLLVASLGLASILGLSPSSGATATDEFPVGNPYNIYCNPQRGDCAEVSVDFAGTDYGGGACEARFYTLDDSDGPRAYARPNPGYPETLYIPPGRYKVLVGRRWDGGQSYASARPITIALKQKSLMLPACQHSYMVGQATNWNGIPISTARLIPYGENDPTEVVCRRDDLVAFFEQSIGCGQKLLLVDSAGHYEPEWLNGGTSFWTAGEAGSASYGQLRSTRPIGRHEYHTGDDTLRGVVDAPDLSKLVVRAFWSDDPTGPVEALNDDIDERDGSFTIRRMPTGDFKLSFGDGLWYGGRTFEDAVTVHVTPVEQPPLHITLPQRGTLTGLARGPQGDRLGGILARLRAPDGTVLAEQVTRPFESGYGVDVVGRYTFSDVPVGDYTVELSDVENLFATRYLGGSRDLAGASMVSVPRGDTVTAPDTVLAHGLYPILGATLKGSAIVGRTVAVLRRGTWSQSPLAFTYQWQRDGEPVSGATGPTYRFTGADRGHRLSVRLTGHRAGYPDAVAESRQTAQVR